MGLGYVEGVTHDYIRHGTTTLFAALDVATGEVLTQCKPRHRHQEFLGFLRQIEKSVPECQATSAFGPPATGKLAHLTAN
jgi:putative transposase